MRPERRNYYRILQLRSDAHPEAIEHSYRRLLNRLKLHPDPTDEYSSVERLHEAYAVLSHPKRRSTYDARRSAIRHPAQDAAVQAQAAERQPLVGGNCPFCGAAAPAVIATSSRCTSCKAPLAPVLTLGPLSMPYFGRAHARTPQSDFARLRLQRTGPIHNVKLRDLSAGGVSFYCAQTPAEGSPLHLITPRIDTVARVIKLRAHGPLSIVHARMLSACYRPPAGSSQR